MRSSRLKSALTLALPWRVHTMPERAAAVVRPGRSGDVPMLAPALADFAADGLGRLIDTARRQAIANGVRPVPAVVSRSLLGYFPPALLQKTRYASGGVGRLTLPALALSYGDAQAMTLGDVVVFKAEFVAQDNLRVWAHELTHVMQYQRWGIEGFVRRYITDSAAVEREANDNAERFMLWRKGA